MKTSRFSDSQIIAVLKQAESGSPAPKLCREYGISSARFYKWRSKTAVWQTKCGRTWGKRARTNTSGDTANAVIVRLPVKMPARHTSISIAKVSAREWPVFDERVDVYAATIRP